VRLYPAFWFAVLTTTAVITVWPVYQKRLSAAEILANLTMLQELLGVKNVDMSYWSLTVEVLFYLLFAAVVARGLTYRRAVLFCAVWTVMAIAAPGLGFGWLSTLVGARYAPYFIAGIALYLVYRFGANLLLWAIVGLSWMLSLFRLRGDATYLGQPYVVLAAIVSVFFLVMIAVAVGLSSRVKARWLVNAGALTYPLYLIHQVVGLTVIAMLHQYLPAWLFLGSLVVALLVVAWLIHRLVERPVSGWMKRNLTASLARIRSAD
jgi:peptidoglycan/LPS O-acetylase OafA/YrhL